MTLMPILYGLGVVALLCAVLFVLNYITLVDLVGYAIGWGLVIGVFWALVWYHFETTWPLLGLLVVSFVFICSMAYFTDRQEVRRVRERQGRN